MAVRIGFMDVLGVTLVGIPPVGVVHVELVPGLTALYGVNGAGKTRVLEGIRAVLMGEAPSAGAAYLHVRVDDELYDRVHGWPHALQVAVAGSVRDAQAETMRLLAEFRDDVYATDDEGWDELALGLREFAGRISSEEFSPASLTEAVAAHLDARLAWPASSSLAEGYRAHEKSLREIVGNGLFTLQPVGRASEPRWLVHAAGDMAAQSTFRQIFLADWAADAHLTSRIQQLRGRLASAQPEQDPTSRPLHTGFPWLEIHGVTPLSLLQAAGPGAWQSPPDWPQWACMPLMEVGHVVESPLAVIDALGELEHAALDQATLDAVMRVSAGSLIDVLMDGDVEYIPEVLSIIQDRERQAFDLASLVLSPAPTPVFDLSSPQRWLRGDTPRWKAEIAGEVLDLHRLSWAERRWSCVGIAMANARPASPADAAADAAVPAAPRVLLCDEPERGLHRRAEQHLPRALHDAGIAAGAPVIVATHSPALLNDPRVAVVHVSRDPLSERTRTRALRASMRSALDRDLLIAELGLTPADLLQLTRVFVLVEGAHDRIVVEQLLGDDLDAAYATCIPVGGAKTLTSLVDSDLLFSFTDAQVVTVLDNLDTAVISTIWSRFRAADAAADDRAADKAMFELERVPGGEARWLRNLAEQARRAGMLDRIHIHGLRQPDVICYLPTRFFVKDATSWEPLLADWRRHHAPRTPTDLKGWLKEHRGARIARKTIEGAALHLAETGAPVDEDLVALGLRLRELASWRQPGTRPVPE